MTGRSPARLLAPLALVVTALALIIVVSSGGEDTAQDPGTAQPAATATATPEAGERRERRRARTYTVKPGDIPTTIAEQLDVSVEDLLAANPDVSPSALSPGQKLKIPE